MAKKRKGKAQAPLEPPAPPRPRPWIAWAVIVPIVVAGIGIAVAVIAAQRSAQESLPAPPPLKKSDAPPIESVSTAPLKPFRVVNAHDHLASRKYLGKYLKAAEQTGVVKTLFVASSDYTLMGTSQPQTKGNDENTEETLAAARENPDTIIPFCTIHPGDPDKLDRIRKYVAEGAKGLKLYTGHGNFYDRPLDTPDMMPVYAYCEETGLAICWHVNITKYAAEFERVMQKFPKLKVIVPHFGVTFFRPREAPFREFERLMATYPNLYTDTSFGTRKILVQGFDAVSRDPEPFRAFIRKFGDRVLFGTDMVITGNREKTEQWIADVLRACRELLEKDVYTYALGAAGTPYAVEGSANEHGTFRGLALDDDTLKKIYETNILKLVP